MRIFLDTNILVDLIADRKPFSQHAIKIFQAAEQGKIKLYTSSYSILTTHFLLKKYLSESNLREVLLNLLEYVSIVSANGNELKIGLRSPGKNFDDGVQILCAAGIEGISFIVTRNLKDFKASGVPVLSPDELCLKLD